MIDKIASNGAYDYPNQNSSKKHPAVQAYENTPGAREISSKVTKKASQKVSKTASRKRTGQKEQGVVLDLSAKGREQASGQKKNASWLDGLRSLFAPVLLWLKKFWESDAPDTSKTMHISETSSDAADISLESEMAEPQELEEIGELPPLDELDKLDKIDEIDKKMEEAVKSGSINQLEQALTADGTRHLAHNSDLLTYYDRRGRIVEIGNSERHRVLYGDKNVLKL